MHRGLKRCIEFCTTIGGCITDCGRGVSGCEKTLDLEKIAERNFAAKGGRGDNKECKTLGDSWGGCCCDVVDVVGGVSVG